MDKPASVADLTALGRVRLSDHFFMRDMLYSEVANFHGLSNIPDDPDLAIATGEKLCQLVLEPLHRAFGGIAVRSAFRSATVNDYCHQRMKPGQGDYFCSDNVYGAARHIWDLRDVDGYSGATASVVIPWYLDHFERTDDHRPLGWWIRDHIPDYAEVLFYPWLCAFNIRWYEGPADQVILRDSAKDNEDKVLTRRGMDNFDGEHADHYAGFPQEA
ncbi:MAG: hypothetical protein VCD33_17485 [Alphaproteobacteria bacterium]|jgi:hypothetical protein